MARLNKFKAYSGHIACPIVLGQSTSPAFFKPTKPKVEEENPSKALKPQPWRRDWTWDSRGCFSVCICCAYVCVCPPPIIADLTLLILSRVLEVSLLLPVLLEGFPDF